MCKFLGRPDDPHIPRSPGTSEHIDSPAGKSRESISPERPFFLRDPGARSPGADVPGGGTGLARRVPGRRGEVMPSVIAILAPAAIGAVEEVVRESAQSDRPPRR